MPSNFLIAKFRAKKKKKKLGPKMPYLGVLGYNFESAPPNLSNGNNFSKKSLNLGPKIPYLGIFVSPR